MGTLYSTLCSMADMHTKIIGGSYTGQLKIDLEEKSLKSGNRYLIYKGMLNEDFLEFTDGTALVLADLPLVDSSEYEDPYGKVKDLYEKYRKSVPTRESTKRKYNFRGLTSDELTMDELMNGEDRIKAAYKLELYILLGVMAGVFKWKNPDHWYWKCKSEPGLILYRKWFE